MQRLLVINGCSHSAGSEIPGPWIGDGRGCRDSCFGTLVARKLGRIPVHLAYPGGSNDWIARSSAAWLADHYQEIKNEEINVMFLVHWTGAERTEYSFPDHPHETKFIDYNHDTSYRAINIGTTNQLSGDEGKVYQMFQTMFVENPQFWVDNKIKNIIYLQGLFKSLNIPYWFGDAFHLETTETQTFNSLIKLVDKKYFPYHNNRDMSYYWMCSNAGFKNQDKTNTLWHLGGDAHKYYADWLMGELKKAGLHG